MPLKGIPFIISPDLLHALSSAGHGDEIVFADAHFPTSSICSSGIPKEIRADAMDLAAMELLDIFPKNNFSTADPYIIQSKLLKINPPGHGIPALLFAITQLFPIDCYDSDPITVMDIEPCDRQKFPEGAPIWKEYEKIIITAEPSLQGTEFLKIKRSCFYDKAKKAFAIVATGESAQYGNIILRKGIVATT